jgi:hypothetical protein
MGFNGVFGQFWLAAMVAGSSATAIQAQDETGAPTCTGIVTDDVSRMYDFKLGDWNIQWRSQTSNGVAAFQSVSTVYLTMEGQVMIDEQRWLGGFKGHTFRTFVPADGQGREALWTVRWLPASSPPFDFPISATLEDCVPVERHRQNASSNFAGDDREVEVVTRFTDITEDSFKFRQDWSFDGGETWTPDVLYYEATRIVEASE